MADDKDTENRREKDDPSGGAKDNLSPADKKAEAKRIKEEKKQLKLQSKELAKQKKALAAAADDDEEEGGALSVVIVTVVIVLIWLAILALLIKLDVGGFGSNVLAPVLKDVPGINKILPAGSTESVSGDAVSGDNVINGGYDNLDDAVAHIKELEQELSDAQSENNDDQKKIDDLTAEVARLKTFEDNQVAFEKIKDEFDNEVVFNSNAPDISEYQKYYEQIDPTNAQILYKEVVQQEQTDQKIEDYAKAYSAMKPAEAAAIFDSMTDDLELAAKILETMSADSRGAILGKMDTTVAAQVTKIMEPDETAAASQ